MGRTRKASRMARLARSSTTTSSVSGSTTATRAWPASIASTAPTTAARACSSAGDSSVRRSQSSSMIWGKGDAGAALLMLGQPSGSGLAVPSDGVPPSPRRLRAVPVIGSALVLALAAIGYLVFGSPRHTSPPPPPPPPPGRQPGPGETSIPLDTDQAGIAAPIAGIAARHRLPQRAVTIALAAALLGKKHANPVLGEHDQGDVF